MRTYVADEEFFAATNAVHLFPRKPRFGQSNLPDAGLIQDPIRLYFMPDLPSLITTGPGSFQRPFTFFSLVTVYGVLIRLSMRGLQVQQHR